MGDCNPTPAPAITFECLPAEIQSKIIGQAVIGQALYNDNDIPQDIFTYGVQYHYCSSKVLWIRKMAVIASVSSTFLDHVIYASLTQLKDKSVQLREMGNTEPRYSEYLESICTCEGLMLKEVLEGDVLDPTFIDEGSHTLRGDWLWDGAMLYADCRFLIDFIAHVELARKDVDASRVQPKGSPTISMSTKRGPSNCCEKRIQELRSEYDIDAMALQYYLF